MTRQSPVVLWRFIDGKAGHERQSEGLVAALAARVPLEVHDLPADPGAGVRAWLTGRCPAGGALPAPRLAIGAGRACRWPLLAARRAHGARAVCLMRPGLPTGWFDACIVPRHDAPRESATVIASEGPLNPLRPSPERDAQLALVLIGGPSAHHGWDTDALARTLAAVVARRPGLDWQLADSRRTPDGCLETLARALPGGVRLVPHRASERDWLPTTLPRAAYAWVTADSMAMIFEALTAGARTGVLDVPARRSDRITRVAHDLCARGLAGSTAGWLDTGELPSAPAPLAEAERCAGLLLERFPELGTAA